MVGVTTKDKRQCIKADASCCFAHEKWAQIALADCGIFASPYEELTARCAGSTLKRAFTREPLPRPRLALLPMNTFGRADEPTIFPARRIRGEQLPQSFPLCPYI